MDPESELAVSKSLIAIDAVTILLVHVRPWIMRSRLSELASRICLPGAKAVGCTLYVSCVISARSLQVHEVPMFDLVMLGTITGFCQQSRS